MNLFIKKIIILSLALLLILNTSYKAKSAQITFSDVKENDWYYRDVMDLFNYGIVNGYEDGTFKGNNKLTKAQFVKMFVTAVLYDHPVDNDYWAKEFIFKAQLMGMIEKKEILAETYDNPITREEIANICAKLFQADDKYLTDAYKAFIGTKISDNIAKDGIKNYKDEIVRFNEKVNDDFEKYKVYIKDIGNITPEYKQNVFKIYSLGILGGYPDGTFKPEGVLTRAEAAVVIQRILDKSRRVQIIKAKMLSADDIKRLQKYKVNDSLYETGEKKKFVKLEEFEKNNESILGETVNIAKLYMEKIEYGIDNRDLHYSKYSWKKMFEECVGNKQFTVGDKILNASDYADHLIRNMIIDSYISEAEFSTNGKTVYMTETGTIRVRGITEFIIYSKKDMNTLKNMYGVELNKKYSVDTEIEIVSSNGIFTVNYVKWLNNPKGV